MKKKLAICIPLCYTLKCNQHIPLAQSPRLLIAQYLDNCIQTRNVLVFALTVFYLNKKQRKRD